MKPSEVLYRSRPLRKTFDTPDVVINLNPIELTIPRPQALNLFMPIRKIEEETDKTFLKSNSKIHLEKFKESYKKILELNDSDFARFTIYGEYNKETIQELRWFIDSTTNPQNYFYTMNAAKSLSSLINKVDRDCLIKVERLYQTTYYTNRKEVYRSHNTSYKLYMDLSGKYGLLAKDLFISHIIYYVSKINKCIAQTLYKNIESRFVQSLLKKNITYASNINIEAYAKALVNIFYAYGFEDIKDLSYALVKVRLKLEGLKFRGS